VPDRGDAKLLQGFVRQARKNRLIYFILAECRLVLPEAQAPQPDHNVHDGRPLNHGWRTSSAGEARVSRVALGFPGLCKVPRTLAAASAAFVLIIARFFSANS
jgi:hypothetical protein